MLSEGDEDRAKQVRSYERATRPRRRPQGRRTRARQGLTEAVTIASSPLPVYLQLQVNPTTIGNQDTSVEIDDETELLARVAHTTRVLP